jgi:hypothetical protein
LLEGRQIIRFQGERFFSQEAVAASEGQEKGTGRRSGGYAFPFGL